MVPGYRGPIIATDEMGLPNTAPVLSSDINQFMHGFDSQPAQTIPSISCNNNGSISRNFEGFSGYNYGGTYMPNLSGNSPPTPPQKPVLRPIEVQHVQTSTEPEKVHYQIRINPSPGNNYMTSNNQPETRGWTQHPIQYNHNYQNVTYPNNTAFPQVPQSLPVSQPNINTNQSYISPSDERNYGGSFGQNQFATGSQHLSQAHIYLQTPNASNQQPGNRLDRTMHSPVIGGGHYDSNTGAMSDYRMSPNFLRSPSSPGQPQVNTAQSPQQQFGRPFVVEIKTSGPERVASQIQYFNKLSGSSSNLMNTGSSGLSSQTLGPVLGSNSDNSSTSTFVPCNPPHSSYVDRLYTPERPSVINLPGTNTSQGEAFLQFPHMPNYCRVPAHQHGPIRSASTESEPVLGSELDIRHVRQMPLISPASSHSSLSSDMSAREPQRPRSGSIEDPEYTEALLSHQKARMEKLIDDMQSAGDRVNELKSEVTELESSVIERKRKRNSSFPSSVDLARLRNDNLQLQADIQLFTREIDLYNNGQTPLGIIDPLEQQNFYKNMNNTGQRGSIYASASLTPPTFTSTVTTSISSTTTPSTPTRPPPDIPPTLPPRDTPPPLPPRMSYVPPPPPLQPIIGSGDSEGDGEQWNCSACTFLNHPALNKCECCEMPRMNASSLASPRGSAAAHVHSDLCYCHDH